MIRRRRENSLTASKKAVLLKGRFKVQAYFDSKAAAAPRQPSWQQHQGMSVWLHTFKPLNSRLQCDSFVRGKQSFWYVTKSVSFALAGAMCSGAANHSVVDWGAAATFRKLLWLHTVRIPPMELRHHRILTVLCRAVPLHHLQYPYYMRP